jgi:hypothetical protein
MRRISLIALFVASFSFACRVDAAVVTLEAALDSQHARPPNLVPAIGHATATINDATGEILVSGSYRTASHVTSAEIRGPNSPPADYLGPVIMTLTTSANSVDSGETGTFSGAAIFDPSQVAQLLDGEYFVAVDTTTQIGPGPSIGGALVVPDPAALHVVALFACGGALRLRRRRSQA